MRSALIAATLALCVADRNGIPPQTFQTGQCIFHRRNLGSAGYSWDLSALAMSAGNEYSTAPGHDCGNAPCPTGVYPTIIFNVCGTVGRSAAPYSTVGTLPLGVNTNLPNPHIRGTAVQFIDPPNSNNICADIDTCDQDTNPTCIPGSNNYDGSMAGTTSPITGLIVGANAQRQAVCGTYVCPPPGLPGTRPARDPSGSYQYCCVGVTYCSDNSEVLAYYDGDDENVVGEPPIFNLFDENSPSGGINISYIGAKAYSADPFSCAGFLDPATGLGTERVFNLYIKCDASVKGRMVIESSIEQKTCHYYVTARHAAACPISGNLDGCTAGTKAGFTFLGLLVVAPALALIVLFCDARGWLDPVKNRMPAWMTLPTWLGGSGGGGGGSYSSSYKSVGATGSSAPIASAYGSA